MKLPILLFIGLYLIGNPGWGQKTDFTIEDSSKVLQILSDIKLIKGHRNTIDSLSKKALTIAESINYQKGIALSKSLMMDSYLGGGEYAKAVEYNLDATSRFEKLGMKERAIDLEISLSTIYKSMGAERGTVDYLLKALGLACSAETKARILKDDILIINSLNNQGIILRDMRYIQQKPELMDSAYVKFQEATKMLESSRKNDIQLQRLYNNISQVYIEHFKDYDKALKVLNKAIAINNELNSPFNLSYNYANLSNLYKEKGDYKKAKEYAFKMLAIGNSLKMPHRVMNAYGHLRTINKLTHQYDSALYYYEKRVELNDSLTNLAKTEQVADFQTKYETVKKELEISTLNKDNELKSKQTFWISILGLIILIGLILSIRNYRILRKKKRVIEEQSDAIQSSLTEKETLLREIHHRVKNNLQIISSLLNIQSSNIDDPKVLSSIKEGQSRVQAMSLIHQNLYQSEHINDVDIENYLKELVNYLSDIFTGNNKSIEVEVDAKNIKFDIDTAIPLGLIVNELVSNAYKYAFDKRDKGKIKVRIKALNEIDYELHVDDDGVGLPYDFDPTKSKSLGLKLVKILSKQLRGKYAAKSDKGANFTVFFKDIRAYQKL
ncbi:MAG: two-component sensor histidine kinase [Algoriphagus sp.]|jgi:two-component sensor histidine kinase